MAIGTDALIEFFGTQDALDNTSGSVADAAYSASGDLSLWTNDDDAPFASVTLECAFTVAPDAGSTVALYCALQDVQSTNDNQAPDADYTHTYLGYFPLNNVTTTQFITIDVSLRNYKTSSVYRFFIYNDAGQTMSAGWDIFITPKTVGPHA